MHSALRMNIASEESKEEPATSPKSPKPPLSVRSVDSLRSFSLDHRNTITSSKHSPKATPVRKFSLEAPAPANLSKHEWGFLGEWLDLANHEVEILKERTLFWAQDHPVQFEDFRESFDLQFRLMMWRLSNIYTQKNTCMQFLDNIDLTIHRKTFQGKKSESELDRLIEDSLIQSGVERLSHNCVFLEENEKDTGDLAKDLLLLAYRDFRSSIWLLERFIELFWRPSKRRQRHRILDIIYYWLDTYHEIDFHSESETWKSLLSFCEDIQKDPDLYLVHDSSRRILDWLQKRKDTTFSAKPSSDFDRLISSNSRPRNRYVYELVPIDSSVFSGREDIQQWCSAIDQMFLVAFMQIRPAHILRKKIDSCGRRSLKRMSDDWRHLTTFVRWAVLRQNDVFERGIILGRFIKITHFLLNETRNFSGAQAIMLGLKSLRRLRLSWKSAKHTFGLDWVRYFESLSALFDTSKLLSSLRENEIETLRSGYPGTPTILGIRKSLSYAFEIPLQQNGNIRMDRYRHLLEILDLIKGYQKQHKDTFDQQSYQRSVAQLRTMMKSVTADRVSKRARIVTREENTSNEVLVVVYLCLFTLVSMIEQTLHYILWYYWGVRIADSSWPWQLLLACVTLSNFGSVYLVWMTDYREDSQIGPHQDGSIDVTEQIKMRVAAKSSISFQKYSSYDLVSLTDNRAVMYGPRTFKGKWGMAFLALTGYGIPAAAYRKYTSDELLEIAEDPFESSRNSHYEFSRMHTLHTIIQSQYCMLLQLFVIFYWRAPLRGLHWHEHVIFILSFIMGIVNMVSRCLSLTWVWQASLFKYSHEEFLLSIYVFFMLTSDLFIRCVSVVIFFIKAYDQTSPEETAYLLFIVLVEIIWGVWSMFRKRRLPRCSKFGLSVITSISLMFSMVSHFRRKNGMFWLVEHVWRLAFSILPVAIFPRTFNMKKLNIRLMFAVALAIHVPFLLLFVYKFFAHLYWERDTQRRHSFCPCFRSSRYVITSTTKDTLTESLISDRYTNRGSMENPFSPRSVFTHDSHSIQISHEPTTTITV